jgi:hypothetical protein
MTKEPSTADKRNEPFNTTMEVWNTTRDGIATLAKITAPKQHMTFMTNKQYLDQLINRELEAARANGDLND